MALGGAWRRYRGWPLWVQILIAVVVLGVLIGSFAGQPTERQNTSVAPPAVSPDQAPTACQPVGSTLSASLSELRGGATVEGEMLAVASTKVEGVWFVAAKVDGAAAVWSTNADPQSDDLGLAIVANDVARRYSDFGIDVPLDSPAAQDLALDDSEAIAAAEACVR